MLENFFIHPQSLRWLRLGPLGPHMDKLADYFSENYYSRHSTREILRGIAHFSRYAMWKGISSPADLTAQITESFFKEHLPACSCERPNRGMYQKATASVQHVMDYLQRNGIIVVPEPSAPTDPISLTLQTFKKYLTEIRGVSAKTADLHIRQGYRFLADRQKSYGSLDLSKLTAKDVIDYLEKIINYRHSFDWRSTIIYCLRTFLRFLRWERIIDQDLSRVIPSVIQWKLADIPRHIPFESVQKLIDAADRSTPAGKRDRAILMLLGILGLRSSEVLGLTLDNIDWRNQSILIPSNKVRKERTLPLVAEVAEALSDYIKNGRSNYQKYRTLFLSTRAPLRPLSSGGSMVTIVRKYIHQTGIESPSKGPHLLRHSLATKLVNSNVPLKEIADILGHSSLNNTRIYSKVNLGKLKAVALPFPSLEGDGQ